MKKFVYMCLVAGLFTLPKAYADDIDIYVNATVEGSEPYVMLDLDWRPPLFGPLCDYGPSGDCKDIMSPEAYAFLESRADGGFVNRFEGFVAVFQAIVSNPLFDPIYMGLMISNFDEGGTILEGYKQLGTDKEELIATMKAIPTNPSQSTTHQLFAKETYFEWHRYINGRAIFRGTSVDDNFGGDASAPSYDADIISGTNYISPFDDPSACPKLFSIMIALNTDQGSNIASNEIRTEIPVPKNNPSFPDMLTAMHDPETDLLSTITQVTPLQKTWVISDGVSTGTIPSWSRAGGTGAPLDLTDPVQLEKDLTDAFNEVISVSSTFVAASVPVNVFNRTDTLDNVYVALFEAQSTLRWPGNLKKLKLADSDLDGRFDEVQDANGEPGFESTGNDIGRITFNALTFWTDKDELPVEEGLPNEADGRTVSRGGAGQKIKGFIDGNGVVGETNATTGARQMFVEPATITNGGSNSLDPFNADNTTAEALHPFLLPDLADGTDVPQALELIQWGRGLDIDDEDADGETGDPRPWLLGDAIHSRPLAINYGTTGSYTEDNPNIRIFMGTNDGVFHIFENTEPGSLGTESGEEVFAFYPRESLDKIALRRTNTESSNKMRYGVDGTPVALVIDNNQNGNVETADNDKVYVYVGMRRGGNSYYAFDVSDPSATPILKWKISQTDGGDFDELGMTFATPTVGKVKFGSTSTNVLIFTGGYNGGWNDAYTSRVGKDLNDADDDVGNAIYIVNTETGELIWKAVGGTTTGASSSSSASGFEYTHADMVDSFPSSVSVLSNLSGDIHRIYVGDSGGAVWRVDIPEVSDPADVEEKWFVTKFAELGTDGATTDRRFFHEPDLIESYDAGGNFDGVLITSGNRAGPLETDVSNYLFYLKDRYIDSGNTMVKSREPLVIDDISDQTACVTGTEGSCNASLPLGWKLQLTDAGEKGLATPLVDSGLVFVSTYAPTDVSEDVCGVSEGGGSVYVLNLVDGTAPFNDQRKYYVGPGIPPGALTLGDEIFFPGGGINLGDLDGDGIDDGRKKLFQSLGKNLWIMYWREPGIDDL
ncbi:pilus assembly protein [Porticoccus sp.]|uniref:pilus assembly protein n=1 Tax=Porticoccus sp. TaxID=2024853 RepID=UPI003F6A345A